jgi:hypothetical protein
MQMTNEFRIINIASKYSKSNQVDPKKLERIICKYSRYKNLNDEKKLYVISEVKKSIDKRLEIEIGKNREQKKEQNQCGQREEIKDLVEAPDKKYIRVLFSMAFMSMSVVLDIFALTSKIIAGVEFQPGFGGALILINSLSIVYMTIGASDFFDIRNLAKSIRHEMERAIIKNM